MPASPPYIPARDADFALWADNFSALITAAPALYGLMASDAAVIATSVDAWDTAYAAAVAGDTRGPFTISAKDVQRVDTTATLRPYAQLISNNAGVTVDNKIAVGVNPRTNPPAPITTPNTNPILSVISAIQLGHQLRYRDQLASPSVKAKPYGVIAVQLFGAVSTTVVTDPSALPYLGAFTKSPLQVTWDSTAAGKQAYYAARWQTRTGLVGPWSPVVVFTVPSGST